MKASIPILLALLLTMPLTAAPSAAQIGTLDQESTGTGSISYRGSDLSQTFTAGRTGSLTQVDVLLHRFSSFTTNFTVEIRAVTATGAPTGTDTVGTGTVLASKALPSTGISTDLSAPTWVSVDFASPPAVTSGTSYAILVLQGADGLHWRSASYDRGAAWVCTPCWDPTTRDFAFKTYVLEPPTATPTATFTVTLTPTVTATATTTPLPTATLPATSTSIPTATVSPTPTLSSTATPAPSQIATTTQVPTSLPHLELVPLGSGGFSSGGTGGGPFGPYRSPTPTPMPTIGPEPSPASPLVGPVPEPPPPPDAVVSPPPCVDELVVFGEAPVFSVSEPGVVTHLAQPGEVYRVLLVEEGFALVVLTPAGDPEVLGWLDLRGDPEGLEGQRVCQPAPTATWPSHGPGRASRFQLRAERG